MGNMLSVLLLLLLFGSVQRGISQLPEWSTELEVSGEKEWIPQPDFRDDTYWSGTAPVCLGGCKARHQELRKDRCGNSSCCWFGHKSLCRVNCGRPDVDYNGILYGNDWWVGSVVRYACRSGFMLVGNPTRSCQPNGLWTPKPTCLRMCQRGRVEINERELNGTCNSTCADKSYFGPPKQGCTQINNCKKKETGWQRFFVQCAPCICDCTLSCGGICLESMRTRKFNDNMVFDDRRVENRTWTMNQLEVSEWLFQRKEEMVLRKKKEIKVPLLLLSVHLFQKELKP